MANKLVLALFDNEAAADTAAEALKQWDKQSDEVKLGAIAVLAKDENGEIKTHKFGKRRTWSWTFWFALASLLVPPVGIVGAGVAGGVLGSFSHKDLGMSDADKTRIAGELSDGKAALGAVTKPEMADAVAAKIAELGGKPETYEVPDAVVAEAAVATEQEPEETPAA